MTSMILVVLLVWGAGYTYMEAAAEQCKGSDDPGAIEVNLSRLRGKWYEYSSFGMLPVVGPRLCHTAAFYPTEDGSYLAIVNDFVLYMNGNPNHNTFRWNVTKEEDPGDKTTLAVAMSLQMTEWAQAMFRVIDTDYNNFIIIYICQNIEEFTFTAGMVLTKQMIVDDGLRGKIKTSIKEKNMSYSKFVMTPKEDCDDVTFPEWAADVGRRDPQPLPSTASGRAKLYTYIPIKLDSARKTDY